MAHLAGMNWDQIEGNWKRYKVSAKQEWGKLSEGQIDGIAGKREALAGRIQEAYGLTTEQTEEQLAAWQDKQRNRNPGAPQL